MEEIDRIKDRLWMMVGQLTAVDMNLDSMSMASGMLKQIFELEKYSHVDALQRQLQVTRPVLWGQGGFTAGGVLTPAAGYYDDTPRVEDGYGQLAE